jgi:hypothetical protein
MYHHTQTGSTERSIVNVVHGTTAAERMLIGTPLAVLKNAMARKTTKPPFS